VRHRAGLRFTKTSPAGDSVGVHPVIDALRIVAVGAPELDTVAGIEDAGQVRDVLDRLAAELDEHFAHEE